MIITSDMIRKSTPHQWEWGMFFEQAFPNGFEVDANELRGTIDYCLHHRDCTIDKVDFIGKFMPEEIQAEIKQAQITVDKKYTNERSRIRRRYAKAIVQWKVNNEAWHKRRYNRQLELIKLYDQAYLPSKKEVQTKLDEAIDTFNLAHESGDRLAREISRTNLNVSRLQAEGRDEVVSILASEHLDKEFGAFAFYIQVPDPQYEMNKAIRNSFINRQNEFASVVANIIDSKYPTFVS